MANVDYRDDEHRYIVSAPAVLTSIAQLLGTNIKDVGRLCTSDKINKWAIYKPQNKSTLGLWTLAERRADNMGLIPQQITCFQNTLNPSATTLNNSIKEWDYKARTAPFRLHDFLCNPVTSNGYNHNAKPCDADWQNININKNYLSKTNRDSLYITHGYSFRLNEYSSTYVNANDNYMPLSYVCPINEVETDQTIQKWYLGIAIHVIITGVRNEWHFIHSNKSLAQATSVQDIYPCFKTNQWLANEILTNMSDDVTYDYFPCLIVNPSDEKTQDSNQYTYVSVGGSKVYCMPSGEKGHTITFFNVISNYTTVIDGNVGYRIKGTYYIKLSTNTNAEVLYIIKGVRDSQQQLLSGWFLARVTYGQGAYGNNSNGFIILYAKVNTNSNVWSLPTSSTDVNSSADNTITSMTLLYKYVVLNGANYAGTEVNAEKTISSITLNKSKTFTLNTEQINKDTSNAGVLLYGYEVNEIVQNLGINLRYVINPNPNPNNN